MGRHEVSHAACKAGIVGLVLVVRQLMAEHLLECKHTDDSPGPGSKLRAQLAAAIVFKLETAQLLSYSEPIQSTKPENRYYQYLFKL
jgi:hypothetical protein